MGCDGGTIPRRDELVRLKKKPEQKDKDSERQFRWLHCALTQQRLQQPIVMCGLGRLYSKQNVIEYLLEKDKMPESANHIKSLKDIKDLNLSSNPSYKNDDKTEGLLDPRNAPFICKLIGLEMSGKFRFVALWSCGCVFSERALKEVMSKVCVLCQKPFTNEDIVILNGTEEDTKEMQIKMEARVAKRKSKKTKKNDSKTVNDKLLNKNISTEISTLASTTSTITSNTSESLTCILPEQSTSKSVKPSTSTSVKPSTSTSTEPSTSGIESASTETKKPEKSMKNKKMEFSLKRTGDLSNAEKMQDPELKKLKTDYSVSKDPKATDVYKSLFTSHSSEKNQNRAHWITYNPFYN